MDEEQVGAVVVDRIAEPWGPRTPYGAGERWPVRVDRHLGPTVSHRRTSSGGCSRRRSCTPTATRWTSRSRTAASSACGAGPSTGSTTAGSIPKDLFGWQANALAGPADPAAGAARAASSSRPTGTTAMGRIVERSQELLDGPGGLGPLRLLHQRPAVPRGVLHPRRHRQGRHRHAAHGRQHPAVHGHRGRRAEGELRDGRPARVVHRRRPLRRASPCGATTWPRPRPCCGCGCSTGVAGPNPPRAARRRPARHARGPGGRRSPRRAQRHQRGVDERRCIRE